jgi:hypothetical protein
MLTDISYAKPVPPILYGPVVHYVHFFPQKIVRMGSLAAIQSAHFSTCLFSKLIAC